MIKGLSKSNEHFMCLSPVAWYDSSTPSFCHRCRVTWALQVEWGLAVTGLPDVSYLCIQGDRCHVCAIKLHLNDDEVAFGWVLYGDVVSKEWTIKGSFFWQYVNRALTMTSSSRRWFFGCNSKQRVAPCTCIHLSAFTCSSWLKESWVCVLYCRIQAETEITQWL